MEKQLKTPVVINFLCGPGNLKSTIASGVFSLLKLHYVNCELVTEFAKDLTWKKDFKSLNNHEFVFKEQNDRLHRIGNEVDVLVTDTSLLFSLIYGQQHKTKEFKRKVLSTYNSYNNLNIVLNRDISKEYETTGRSQNISEAIEIDGKVKYMLNNYDLNYIELNSNESTINKVTSLILEMFNKKLIFQVLQLHR